MNQMLLAWIKTFPFCKLGTPTIPKLANYLGLGHLAEWGPQKLFSCWGTFSLKPGTRPTPCISVRDQYGAWSMGMTNTVTLG